MAGLNSEPRLKSEPRAPEKGGAEEWAVFVGRQIGVARCFGASAVTEGALRSGYKELMRQSGVSVVDRDEQGWRLERENVALHEEGSEYFDTRRLKEGQVLHVDALTSFVNEVAPVLGWKEQIDGAPIVIKGEKDAGRVVEMARVLGLSRYQEEQLYQFLKFELEKASTKIPDRNYAALTEERGKVGLGEGGGSVDSFRYEKRFSAVEVAAVVKRVLPVALGKGGSDEGVVVM